MSDTVLCSTHGETQKAYVCAHLVGETSGLGFNCDEPSDENPFPDAWCDACEVLQTSHGGWNSVPDGEQKIDLICTECYQRCRICNTKPSITLDDLANLKWKCGNCEQWHTGPILDIAYNSPCYWNKDDDKSSRWTNLIPRELKKPSKTFLDTDYCSIDGESFFVRGLIHLPIIGAAESFRWGVWGSLSQTNFEKLLEMDKAPGRVDLPPMFSWLSNQIADYPDTLNLKMYAHIQEPGTRPYFRLERSDHPLAIEYHLGIAPERVKEIMLRRLQAIDA